MCEVWKDVVKLRIAVGVPTLNNFKGLAELFASLWGEEYTPFVVSNWVTNIGVSKAWNEILRATVDYDLTVICNDDIVFHSGSFQNLVNGWSSGPLNAIMFTGISTDTDEKFVEAPDYSCFSVIAREYLEEIGSFDENFTPAYFEDNDSHYRIKLANRTALAVGNARITHKGSQTQNANPNAPIVTSPMFEKNREYYVSKWGGVPGKEEYAHPYGDFILDWKMWRDR